jgi:hypothetical protein
MRTDNPEWDEFRKVHPTLGDSFGDFGYFERGQLRIISSGSPQCTSDCWEHVSVSKANGKMPTWGEMCLVKDMFWRSDEVVVQYHPAKSDYVNYHEACLHLWRHVSVAIPTPPTHLIGPETARKD